MKTTFNVKGKTYKLLEINNSKLNLEQIDKECKKFVKENEYCSIIKSIKDKTSVITVEYYLNGEKIEYNDWLIKLRPEKNLKIVK